MSAYSRIIRPGMKGEDVRLLQAATNRRLKARDQHDYLIAADGDYGPQTARSVSRAAYLLGIHGPRFTQTKREHGGIADKRTQEVIRRPGTRTKAMLDRAESRMKAVAKAAASTPLRERAYKIALHEVGVMESGGNNSGTPLSRYERPNGASGPEPWCGDFQAYCYRKAGSKAVQRLWASVYFLGRIAGLHKTSSPQRGDLVRFTFDHVGMFVRHVSPGIIETIEGNTGASGAVSDGNGRDGVYIKHRSTSLVQDYLRVER